MKLPAVARQLTRRSMGMGKAPPITPADLQQLASVERVIVIGVGLLRAGATDPRLPGEQRVASLLTLAKVVEDLPREQAIALHCG